ncbi:MAG: hypothetical protein VX498_07980, partial [Myxococcota bacterium]|nr:hypothetical protein [Myxococcota bacterium]
MSPVSEETVPVFTEVKTRAGGSDGEYTLLPLGAYDLRPLISAVGPQGAIPDKVVVQFATDVVSEAAVGAITDGTVLDLEPALPGSLVFTSPSTLEFLPATPFVPAENYQVSLKSVGSRDGLIEHPENAAWTHRFSTPEFRYSEVALQSFDAAAGTAEIDLTFTGPVLPTDVSRHARVESAASQGRVVRTVWTATEDPRRVRVRVDGHGFKHRGRLRIKIDSGLKMVGQTASLDAREWKVELLAAERLAVLSVRRQEGPTGFFIEVVCDDSGAEGYRSWWRDQRTDDWVRVSPRCIPEAASARDLIKVEPEARISVSASRHGFRILGDFDR